MDFGMAAGRRDPAARPSREGGLARRWRRMSTAPTNSVYEQALKYHRAGLSVIPIQPDGSKRPHVDQWERFQRELPHVNRLAVWWRHGRSGIGIIGGTVSGHLECLDFDRGELFAPWRDLVEAQAPGLVA